jgi:hypothetical protein
MLFTATAPPMSIQNSLTALTVRGASNLARAVAFTAAPLEPVAVKRLTRSSDELTVAANTLTLITRIRGYSRA